MRPRGRFKCKNNALGIYYKNNFDHLLMVMVHTFLRQKTVSLWCKWLSAFSHILISLTSCLLAAAGNATRGRRQCYSRPLVMLLAAEGRATRGRE